MAVYNGKLWVWNISGTDLLVRADQGGGRDWKNFRVKPGSIESATIRMEKDGGLIPLPDKSHKYGVKIYSQKDYTNKRPNFWARTIKYRLLTGYQILLNAADIGGAYPKITELDPCDVPALNELCEAFDRLIPFGSSAKSDEEEISRIAKDIIARQSSDSEVARTELVEDEDEYNDVVYVNN